MSSSTPYASGGGISPPAGQIGGTTAAPTVTGVTETGGPTGLTLGAIAAAQFLQRSGATLVGATGSLPSSAAWTGFTPTWTAVSVNPAIGNGTLSGGWLQIGKLLVVRYKMVAGSTTTFGTGKWRFALPNALVQADTQLLPVHAYHSATGFHWIGVSMCGWSGAGLVTPMNVAGGVEYDSATPFAWATSDELEITGAIEVS